MRLGRRRGPLLRYWLAGGRPSGGTEVLDEGTVVKLDQTLELEEGAMRVTVVVPVTIRLRRGVVEVVVGHREFEPHIVNGELVDGSRSSVGYARSRDGERHAFPTG